jgi:D-glycero-D-manno-heptose 1,7-bisphosphate phosphatase
MLIKTIFLDRDGVINKDINYLHKIDDFEFINGIFDACLYFHSLGYTIIIVTNQSGIERGYYQEKDYQILNHWMLGKFNERNIKILDTFYCPHGPKSKCLCRKPKPGMLNKAQEKHNIDMKKSWMIGDKEIDIQAANAAGINNTILVKSGHLIDKDNSSAEFFLDSVRQTIQVIN